MTTLPPPPPPAVATPRPASTVVLVRDGPAGLQVLLLRRAERAGDRSSGAWVFPGGTLDAADRAAYACCAGLDDAAASERLELPAHGLAYHVAAIRECFEEAGVLLACDATGRVARVDETWRTLRDELRHGTSTLHDVCARLGVRLAADRLAYFAHWLTPPGLPKRFDTRFFVAAMPPDQAVDCDLDETLGHLWLEPTDALARAAELKLPNPTRRTLQALAPLTSVDACLAHARAQRRVPLTMPRLARGPHGVQPVQPDEACYAEVARLDPHGEGRVSSRIEPGVVVTLSARVRRLTAPNASVMTGPGTNSYLVGDPDANVWAAIDPGPADPAHVDALIAAAPGPIRWILVTHSHRDHSPGAALLKARTGAPVCGMAARHREGHDSGFAPDRTLRDGDTLTLGAAATLRVLHTPGHASNHLCYLLVEERTLFTGDHVMQGSTVVISPPDGDMGDYLASLRALRDEPLDVLAPGHGFLIGEPAAALERIVAHRLAREAKVERALAAHGGAELLQLLPHVYDDVPAALHPVAARSLLAHLQWLERQGRAAHEHGRWQARTASQSLR